MLFSPKNPLFRDFLEIYEALIILSFFVIVGACLLWGFVNYYRAQKELPVCRGHGTERNKTGRGAEQNSPRKTGCIDHEPDSLDVSTLKTGDLLTVCYGDLRTLFSRAVYNSLWTHQGMIWENPVSKELMVLELGLYRAPYNKGVNRIPLINWLRIHQNVEAIGLLRINKALDSIELIEKFARFENSDIGVEALKPNWTRFLVKKNRDNLKKSSFFHKNPIPNPQRASFTPFLELLDRTPLPNFAKPRNYQAFGKVYDFQLTCHEAVICILQEMGVVDSKLSPCSWLPSEVAQKKLPFVNGYSYGTMEQISVKNDCLIAKIH